MLEKILTRQRFSEWAREYAAAVVSTYQPDCIVLFGSVARDTHTSESDIDIVVIGGDLPANSRERFRLLMRLRPRFAPLQVQTFTRREWEEMLAAKHVTSLEALQDGIPLHGQTLFRRWRRDFERWLNLGLRRKDCVWVVPALIHTENPIQRASLS